MLDRSVKSKAFKIVRVTVILSSVFFFRTLLAQISYLSELSSGIELSREKAKNLLLATLMEACASNPEQREQKP